MGKRGGGGEVEQDQHRAASQSCYTKRDDFIYEPTTLARNPTSSSTLYGQDQREDEDEDEDSSHPLVHVINGHGENSHK